jgi:D-glycero-D-manno-heptose 1,7-bisphosphate phosphatase
MPTLVELTTVFLDRDGVINRKLPEGRWVSSVDEFRILPGVPQAIGRLNAAGIRVIVVSNQRGIALGDITADSVEDCHRILRKQLEAENAHVDGIYICPHDRQSCGCRKPLSGLYDQAVRDFPEITPEKSVVIGDSISDIEFGRRLGIPTIWIEGPSESRKPGWEDAAALATLRCRSLPEAVEVLCRR